MRTTFLEMLLPEDAQEAFTVSIDTDTSDLKLRVWTKDLGNYINTEQEIVLVEKERNNELNKQETIITVTFADPCNRAKLEAVQIQTQI